MDLLKQIFEGLIFLVAWFPPLGMGIYLAIISYFALSLFTAVIFVVLSPIIEHKMANKPSGIKKIVDTILKIARALLSIHSYILFLCVISFLLFSKFFLFILTPMVIIMVTVIIQFIIFFIGGNKLNKMYTNIFLLLEPYILIIVMLYWLNIVHTGMYIK